MTDLQRKRFLVVGATGGIGSACARLLASRGAFVVCADVDARALGTLVEQIEDGGGRAAALVVDVVEPVAIEQAVAKAVELDGGLDGGIYCAGVTSTIPAVELPFEEWRRIMAVNLDGAFVVARELARALVAGGVGGTIVFVGSQLAGAAIPGKAHYIASKGALESLTRSLAIELAEHGIRVVCLAPGPTRSGMLLERIGGDAAAEAVARVAIPLGRFAEPDEIAATAAFLLSADAGSITGTTVVADGGYQAW